MPRCSLWIFLPLVALAAGPVLSDVASVEGGVDVVARIEAVADGKVRLDGPEVTKENIAFLAHRHWQSVELVSDQIDAGVIEALRQVGSIRSLALYGRGFSHQIPRLEHVQGLVELKLAGLIDGHDVEAIGKLTQLTSLKLPQEMTINTVGAREIGQLKLLTSLDLYGVDIDDSGLAELAPLVKLEHLDLTHTRVTDDGLKTLAHLPKLKSLELHRHPRWHIKQQISDQCLPTIAGLADLERLSLSGDVSDAGLIVVAKLPRLRDLSIWSTNISAGGLAMLEGSKVKELTLRDGQLGDDPIHSNVDLNKLSSLKTVHVLGGQGSWDIGRWIAAYPKISWGGIGN
jgi:hypothetical protein